MESLYVGFIWNHFVSIRNYFVSIWDYFKEALMNSTLHNHVARSTLYLQRDFSKDAYHSKVFELASQDPYSYAGDPRAALGSPGTTKEAAGAGSLGSDPGLPMGPGPGRLFCGSWGS